MSTQMLVMVLAYALTQQVRGGAESDAECSRKVFNCIQCSTESGDTGAVACRDPFNPALRREVRNLRKWFKGSDLGDVGGGGGILARYNISTVLCEGFCVKWVRATLSDQTISIVRTCSTRMDIRFVQNSPVCIHESRTGKGILCFCKDTMCNAATAIEQGMDHWLPAALAAITLAFCSVN